MKRFLLAVLLSPICSAAFAQSTAVVVNTCGTPLSILSLGQQFPLMMDTNGHLCTNASGGGTQTVIQGSPPWEVNALANDFATGSIVDLYNGTLAPWDSLPSPTGTVTALNGIASLYEFLKANNSHSESSALEAGHVFVSTGSNHTFFGFSCSAITGNAAGYCLALNSTTAPTSGSVTPLDICYFNTPAGCSLSRSIGITYSTGISIVISSNATPFTVTTGTLTGFIQADYLQ